MRSFSIFDYTVTISRRSRYLVVSCPELGFTSSAQSLDSAALSAERIGTAVIQAFDQVSKKIFQLESAGLSPPSPADVQSILKPESRLTTGQAAQALGISKSTLRRRVAHGEIRGERTSGGHLRFKLIELKGA